MSGGGLPRARIGTSGWTYPTWRHGFYAGVPQRRWLAHCAERFTGIEVNATFYRQLKPEAIGGWRENTPPEFAFAVKGHRFVTHVHRLNDVEEPLRRARTGLEPLADRLAAVLWQLPPSLRKEPGLLRDFGERLATWAGTRHVIEFRHRSWFDDETLAILAEHHLATCISDAPRWPMWDATTSDLAYVRLHGHERLYASCYAEDGLRPWAERVLSWLADGCDVHVYFDNDAEGAAPDDAQSLIAMVRAGGGFDP
jgi:uncharacterized protein YecE (DUF72 family)